MKRLTTTIWLLACFAIAFTQPVTQINGTVEDEEKQPVGFVNIYIKGSIDGASTDENGEFTFTTDAQGTVTLIASLIGYETYSITDDVKRLSNLKISLKVSATKLDEFVVYAGNYQLKSASTINKAKAVDLVSGAGSNGDLYNAISMLPGTQAADRDGRLLVRGGSERETQTYIDDMHVLSPYTGAFGEVGSRGRYSPFLFEGINFSMGGYVPEYSQGLSAVLPLYTRDEAKISSHGVDIMNVSSGGSGTFPWRGGSTSFNVNYTDLSLYNALFFPSIKPRWKEPYRQLGLQHQFRFTLGKNTYLKTYLGWSKAGFTLLEKQPFGNDTRNMAFGEDNLYFNTTFRKKYDSGAAFFAGAAYSLNRRKINNAMILNDIYRVKEQEVHLKTKAEKRFTDYYKMTVGAETFFRQYDFHYTDTTAFDKRFEPAIAGAFISNDFNLTNNLFLNLSSRIEYTSLNEKWQLLPRVAIGYRWRGFTASAVAGKYQQNVANEVLIYNQNLLPENNVQTLLGLYYEEGSKILRVEAYRKQYDNLPLNQGNGNYTSGGYGYSNGIDLFFNDTQFAGNWEYMLAYSFNDSRRRHLDFPESATPSFAMRHNAGITLKYTNILFGKYINIISLSNRFASGRAYHDPNRDGFMNGRTPNYNSLDASWILLPSKRVIVYLGFANILNRTNVYGYTFDREINNNARYDSHPLTQQINQGFYIGCFISLGKNAAYNASNF